MEKLGLPAVNQLNFPSEKGVLEPKIGLLSGLIRLVDCAALVKDEGGSMRPALQSKFWSIDQGGPDHSPINKYPNPGATCDDVPPLYFVGKRGKG